MKGGFYRRDKLFHARILLISKLLITIVPPLGDGMEIDLKYTHLFWDFNGTILADMQAGLDSTNAMLRERGLPQIPGVEAYRDIFDFPIKEYYRGLGFDFEKEPYEVLAPLWVDLYNENSKTAQLTDGISEVFENVKIMGVPQIVFSATEHSMLCRQLLELGVTDYFDEIIGLDNIHAESKLHLAKKWRDEHPEAAILYVGDTVHDAANASVLKADCLLYSKGHQSKKRLQSCGFTLIDDIRDVLLYLK